MNGIPQGTDNANKFSFTVPTPAGVVDGTELTATASLDGNTSEFSARFKALMDLDTDNDGIPDLDERNCLSSWDVTTDPNPTASDSLNGAKLTYTELVGTVHLYSTAPYNGFEPTLGSELEIAFNQPAYDLSILLADLDIDEVILVSAYDENNVLINDITGSVVHQGAFTNVQASPSASMQANATGNTNRSSLDPDVVVEFRLPMPVSRIVLNFSASANGGLPEYYIKSFCMDKDTDGDGIVDALDLDSDNDGIYDCVESGVNKPQTNGVLDGPVNANGIPVAADTNGDGVIDYVLRDSNSDGQYDFTSLDSDGDGCPDVIEAGFTDVNSDGTPGPAPITVDGNGLVTSIGP